MPKRTKRLVHTVETQPKQPPGILNILFAVSMKKALNLVYQLNAKGIHYIINSLI